MIPDALLPIVIHVLRNHDMSRPADPLGAVSEQKEWPVRTSRMAIASLALGLLSFFLSLLTAIPAIILGALSLRAISRSGGRVSGKGMAIAGVVTGSIGVLLLPAVILPAVFAARESARRAQCANNLKQIAIAIMNYESSNGCFPPAFSPDEHGKPRCSWRVAILPYIDPSALYNSYNMSVAWDHPANSTTLNTRVYVYSCPSEPIEPGKENFTNFLMVTGPGTFFDPERSAITLMSKIRDGTGSTISVIQSSRKVPWASPDDLVVDVKKPLNLADFKNPHSGGFQAMFVDGSVRFIKLSTPESRIRALLSIAGDEEIPQGGY
jgi:prepilin-type processing-associated H-X9-DG protein